MRFRSLLSSAVALAIFSPLHAQLQWSVFNETATVAAPVSTSTSGVAVPVPAGQRVTLVANNLVPIDLTRDGTELSFLNRMTNMHILIALAAN